MLFHLWDRIRDWVTLGLLLLCSGIFLLTQNKPVLQGLRAYSLEVTSSVEARFAWVGLFFRAVEDNKQLREENIAYSSELARSREARLENERLHNLLGLRDSLAYRTVAARIVAKDIYRQENYLTLDVGKADSVQVGMAVVDEQGIIGKVVFVSQHYSRVMPYLNTKFRVPARVLPMQSDGIVRWVGNDPEELLLEYVVKTEPVEKGQLVVTSGYSGFFQPGYPIGVVDSVALVSGQNVLAIRLKPASPLSTAKYVFVLLNQPKPEQLSLETERFR